jgi:hypothetical protein
MGRHAQTCGKRVSYESDSAHVIRFSKNGCHIGVELPGLLYRDQLDQSIENASADMERTG